MGCGWLGKPLAIALLQNGYSVAGSTTTKSKIKELQSARIEAHLINIHDGQPDLDDFLSTEVLVIAITSKDVSTFKNFIAQIEAAKVSKVIFVSSTSVYPLNNATVTEDTKTKDTALAQIEQLFITHPAIEATILRFGGLFGYDRQPGNFFKPGKKVPNPEGYINLIHRDDGIQIIQQLIKKEVWNDVFNLCADSHPKRRAFYQKQAAKLGRTDLEFDDSDESSYKIVSSKKLKASLDYSFKYGDLMQYE